VALPIEQYALCEEARQQAAGELQYREEAKAKHRSNK
jgi:hypothetical protein